MEASPLNEIQQASAPSGEMITPHITLSWWQ